MKTWIAAKRWKLLLRRLHANGAPIFTLWKLIKSAPASMAASATLDRKVSTEIGMVMPFLRKFVMTGKTLFIIKNKRALYVKNPNETLITILKACNKSEH